MGQILHNNSPFLLCFRKIIIFRKVDMRYIFHLCFWFFLTQWQNMSSEGIYL